jgi:hypothetical protein
MSSSWVFVPSTDINWTFLGFVAVIVTFLSLVLQAECPGAQAEVQMPDP